jgi:multicomponent K+:H+ antiporter subunit E
VSLLGKLVPVPLLSAALWALWIALARSTSPGQVLVGLALAIAVPLLTANLRPTRVSVRRPLVAVRYLLRVAGDVVVSNLEIARGVVAWRWRRPRSRFVIVPLDLRDPVGLAVLSMVTTIVPGTVWSELALDRSGLLLHVWDIGDDEAGYVAGFKARYEAPLREIFE